VRPKVVLGTIGVILKFFSLAFLLPAIPSLYFGEEAVETPLAELPLSLLVFLSCFLLCLAIGLLLERLGSTEDFTDKEGFAIVSGGWLIVAFLASLPFILTSAVGSMADAYFESMSGLTTTGATVLPYPLEQHLQSVLFWRALLQWLGGMGIIVLSVAILTRLTKGGRKLMESEAPGPSLHKLKPTIMQTAKLLWLVYVFFTVAEIICLVVVGVPLYESVYHSFTTMSTGGFSVHTDSIAHYTPIVHWVLMGFMIVAGANFSIHYHALHGRPSEYRKDPEFRFYLAAIGIATLLVAFDLVSSGYVGLGAIRESAFQTISIMTTTGYTTANYDSWSNLSRFVILMIMFIGGCAGSTSGAMKQVRILLLLKMLRNKLRQLLHPHAVLNVRLGRTLDDEALHTVTMFFFAYLLVFVVSTGAMMAFDLDIISGASAVASCLGNVGPALGAVGPNFSYASLPSLAKIWLLSCMWLGRLEIFTALILFVPGAYKRESFLE